MAKGRQKPVFDIDINNVYYELHNVAMENSKAEADKVGCVILNTGVNEKGKSYFGSGQYDVECVLNADSSDYAQNVINAQNDPATFKKSCFAALKKYVEFFLSDAAKGMTEDQLIEVRSEKRDMEAGKRAISESRMDYRLSLIENLFSETDGETSNTPVDDKQAEAEARKAELELEKPEIATKSSGGEIIGYRWRYDNKVAGCEPDDWAVSGAKWVKNAASTTAKLVGWTWGKASGIASKLAGVLGGVTVHTMAGDVTATAKGAVDAVRKAGDVAGAAAKAVGKGIAAAAKHVSQFVDKDEFANALQRNIRKDYPQSDVTDVRAYLSQSLENDLRAQKKLTSDIKRRLQAVKYAIVIAFSRGSKDYPNFNVNTVAAQVAKAYGPWTKRLTSVDLSKLRPSSIAKNIVKVDQVKPVYKIKSSYDQDLKLQIRQYMHDAQNTKDQTKSKNMSEAEISFVANSILRDLFEEKTLSPEQMADELIKGFSNSKYRANLDEIFDGFMSDPRVSDSDVKMSFEPGEYSFESDLKALSDNGKLSKPMLISTKKELTEVIKALTEPVDMPDPPSDASEEKRKDQAEKREAKRNSFFKTYIQAKGTSGERIYTSFHDTFKIVDDFSGTHTRDNPGEKSYDMYVYFDPKIRDLEDED